MARSWSVTLAIALTTTTGFCASRPLTIAAVRSIAFASSTEVPPNFITIMEREPQATDSCGGIQPRFVWECEFSSEVSLDLQIGRASCRERVKDSVLVTI